jgi:hypothetical protein
MATITSWFEFQDYFSPVPADDGSGGRQWSQLWPAPSVPAGATLLRTRAWFEFTYDTEEAIPQQVPPLVTVSTFQFRTNTGNEVAPAPGNGTADFTTHDQVPLLYDYIFDQGIPERLARFRGQVHADSHAQRKIVDQGAKLATALTMSSVKNANQTLATTALWVNVRQLWTWNE